MQKLSSASLKKTRLGRNVRKTKIAASESSYIHLKYHPNDPKSSAIQKAFRESIMHPKGDQPFTELENERGHKIPLDRLTVCYSTHSNLGPSTMIMLLCKVKVGV